MKKIPFALMINCLLLSTTMSYGNSDQLNGMTHPFVTLTGAAAVTSGPNDSNYFTADSSLFTYDVDSTRQTRGVWGASFGVDSELMFFNPWRLQIGFGYYQTGPFTLEGELTQGVLPISSAQFNYDYRIISRQLLAEAKVTRECHENFYPYLFVGIGAAFNRAENFQLYDFPEFLLFSPEFKNNTITSFTYSIGLGIDYEFMSHFLLGVGYRFTDLGRTNLGKGYIDTFSLGPTLNQSNIYTNEFLVQLSYRV